MICEDCFAPWFINHTSRRISTRPKCILSIKITGLYIQLFLCVHSYMCYSLRVTGVVVDGRLREPLCHRGVQLRQTGDHKPTGPEGAGEGTL